MRSETTLWGKVFKGAFAAALLSSASAGAEEKPLTAPPDGIAVKSLQDVLQQAADQGFVDFKDSPHTEDIIGSDITDIDTKAADFGASSAVQCGVSDVLDLDAFKAVSSYEDLVAAKSGVNAWDNFNDLLPLIKTYMALGLGAEMTGAVKGIDGAEARLVESMGRTIEGQSTQLDQQLIAAYAHCNQNMNLANIFSQTSSTSPSDNDSKIEVSRDDLAALEALPTELEVIMTLKIGTAAAEQRLDTVAKRLLTTIAPETKYGDTPSTKDPAVLYFFALVKRNEADPIANQVFKHLAQYDGIYRVRSLQKISEANLDNNLALYDDFGQDLEAVSQQYSGQLESLEAELQLVKQRVLNNKFLQAIDKANQDLGPDDTELISAVSFIAQRIEKNLDDAVKSIRLNALAAFIHDPLFFKNYESAERLTTKAVETAIDLRLPELVSTILGGVESDFEIDQKTLAFSKASVAEKNGDLDVVVEISSDYKSDPEFQALLLRAAIQSDNSDLLKALIEAKPIDRNRFGLEADLAWQDADWLAAQAALTALAKADPDISYADEISLTSYLGQESQRYVDRAAPVSSRDLEILKSDLDSDISLLKRVLSNG
jgi:hypothetical protein